MAVLASVDRARGQGVPAVILADPITVLSIEQLSLVTGSLLDTQIANQKAQIAEAVKLNKSIGYWGNDVAGTDSPHLQSGALAKDYLAGLSPGVTWDNRPSAPASPKTIHGAAVVVSPDDLADPGRLDQVGTSTKEALAALAREIEQTQQDVAATYADMLLPGQTQQKYEKLRGKLQALNLHLENLQAQQHAALDLLQAQGSVNDSKAARDSEIAALIQEANHTENVTALSALKFDALPWR